ncbi:MAG: glycosyltransferase family 4 protein [Patescibacteria group bacterium]|nr:glycosyltransferase family 4 protein [Patescibacteria group bacterium]
MKILHAVQFYFPATGGMQEAVRQISENLARLGHDVTVVTSKDTKRKKGMVNGVKIEEFDITGNAVVGIKGEIERFRKYLTDSRFDIVTNFAATQWATDIMLPVLSRVKAKKVFVPTGFSMLYTPSYSQYFREMKSWMKEYDMNVFLSENYRDINFARENGIKKIRIIPNGASREEFGEKVKIDIKKKLGIPKNHLLILHVGSHTGAKGHSEGIRIFDKADINNATFLIIGNKTTKGCYRSCKLRELAFAIKPKNRRKEKRLKIMEFDRAHTIAAYQAADLFLFPSNIECSPLVLFECMASRTPFLTADTGNAREIIDWSHSGVLLPTIIDTLGYSHVDEKESAGILEKMVNNKPQLQKMAGNGFIAWKNKFTWEKIAIKYENLYKELLCKKN